MSFRLFAVVCVMLCSFVVYGGSTTTKKPMQKEGGAIKMTEEDFENNKYLEGAWRAHLTQNNRVVKQLNTYYIFGKLGWSIRTDEETKAQDWFCLRDKRVFMRPLNVPKGVEDSAVILGTFDPEKDEIDIAATSGSPYGLRLVRLTEESVNEAYTPASLAGDYQLIIEGTPENRISPFIVKLVADGTYTLEADPPMTVGYATGTFVVDENRVTLYPKYAEEGFWCAPAFFMYQSQWIYENEQSPVTIKLVPFKPE